MGIFKQWLESKEESKPWTFPLKLKVLGKTNSLKSFDKLNWSKEVEVPIGNHPGAFAKKRPKDKHRGIDLYAAPGTKVVAVEPGKVVDIFTVPAPEDAPSGKDTQGIAIEGPSGRVTYAEIKLQSKIKVGDSVEQGQTLGKVAKIHDEDSDVPSSMLHFQLATGPTKVWTAKKPKNLLDPTELLLKAK